MLAAAAGASTALSSLAATAGGGEAALLPRFGAEVAGGFGTSGGDRWAVVGRGEPRHRCNISHLLKLRLNSIDASCIADSTNNIKKHTNVKHHMIMRLLNNNGWQGLKMGDFNTGDSTELNSSLFCIQ